MIKNSNDYRIYLKADSEKYNTIKLLDKIRGDFNYKVFKYLKLLRKCEYHHNTNGFLHNLLYFFESKKKNSLSVKLSIFIPINTVGYGVKIYHGNIIINSNAQIGNNCSFHGNNCVGNKGENFVDCPKVGNNVVFGFGSVVVGNITIGSSCKIGALSFVNKNFAENDVTIAGIPAKII